MEKLPISAYIKSKKEPSVKIGTKIMITYMEGEPDYTWRVGVVTDIDDIGQLHGTWGGLAVNPEIDGFKEIKEN